MLESTLEQEYQPMKEEGKVKEWKVYFQDESRFGLMTVLRRAITLTGIKPIGVYQHRFIYRYCYGLVDPMQGDFFFVTAPHVNTFYFQYLLFEFSLHEPQTYKIIFLDGAGYHKAKHLVVPENIRLIFLPPANPELNPVERFWQDLKSKIAFHNFSGEDELEKWIEKTILNYSSDYIASLTGYPYIKNAIMKALFDMEYS